MISWLSLACTTVKTNMLLYFPLTPVSKLSYNRACNRATVPIAICFIVCYYSTFCLLTLLSTTSTPYSLENNVWCYLGKQHGTHDRRSSSSIYLWGSRIGIWGSRTGDYWRFWVWSCGTQSSEPRWRWVLWNPGCDWWFWFSQSTATTTSTAASHSGSGGDAGKWYWVWLNWLLFFSFVMSVHRLTIFYIYYFIFNFYTILLGFLGENDRWKGSRGRKN